MGPVNWSQVEMFQFLDSYMPYRYQVDDAQNLIAYTALQKEFEWLLLYEHDVLPPPGAFIELDKYMRERKYPIVSGLYFARSYPSDPLIFRGRGNGAFYDWKMGDLVWCDGVPTGFLLIHMSVIKALWDDSELYTLNINIGPIQVRRVFNTPRDIWVDPETGWYNTRSGTSDLAWCTRVMKGDYLRKAGWGKFVDELPDPRYPFVVDTNLFCRHIEMDGTQFPNPSELERFKRNGT